VKRYAKYWLIGFAPVFAFGAWHGHAAEGAFGAGLGATAAVALIAAIDSGVDWAFEHWRKPGGGR
jgi:hypothetical protein